MYGGIPSPNPSYSQPIKTVTNKLPNEYQEVEYIRGTGSQYFSLDIYASNLTDIDIKYRFASFPTNNPAFLFGSYSEVEGVKKDYRFYYNIPSPQIKLQYDGSTYYIDTTKVDNNIHKFLKQGSKIYIDETLIGTNSTSFANDFVKMHLFISEATNNGTTKEMQHTNNGTTDVFECKIYDNNILVRNLIPCYRKSDNKPGMYDTVNNVFYTNQGTGEFTLGPSVGNYGVVVQNKNLAYVELEGEFRSYQNGAIRTNSSYNGYIARTLENSTYVISFDSNETPRGDISNLCYLDKNMNFISGIGFTTDTIIHTPNNCAYISIAVSTTQTKFQIEVGSTATTYTAHAEQTYPLCFHNIELCKIGDYQDVITGTKDNWKVVRNVGKYVFNKADITGFTTNLTNTNMAQFRNSTYLNNTLHRDNIEVLCNISKGKNVYSLDEVGTFTFYNVNLNFGGIYIRFLKTDFSSQAELATYIDNNTINYYFPLYTPTEETITDTTLVSQLNALADAYGYSGTTNIMTLSATNNAEMPVEVHYNFVTPAPSPDRPSEVKVVTGDNNVVIQNKNWFNKNMERTYNGNASKTVLDTGVKIVDTANSSGNHYAHFTFIDLSGLEGKILRIKATVTANSNNKGRIIGRISNNISAVGNSVFNVFDEGSYTIPNDLQDNKYFGISLYSNYNGTWESGCYVDYTNLIVTIDDEDMTYVAHQEQSTTLHLGSLELCKIGDYQDAITGTKDNWKIIRKVGKIVYDGSSDENWELNQAKQYCTQFIGNTISDAINETEYTQKSYTNYFKFQQGNPTDTTQDGYYWKFQKRLVIVIPNTLASTVADLRTWLSTHNVVFYYRLAEPTEETITDTTLINELNAIYNAQGYDGQTNIMTISSSTNADLVVNVKALKEFPSE